MADLALRNNQEWKQRRISIGWGALLVGQFLVIFAVVALSGPGRMDIVDGQTRYEVARSLVEHGDSIIRDPNVAHSVFHGRNEQLYTPYRFPQIAAGVVAILAADHTGGVSEGRRHFFFTLTSAWACAVLAVSYTLWFRALRYGALGALGWSCAGIFCTPCWFYGTSTFDDILGTAAVVGAVTLAFAARRRSWSWALAAGLVLGLAFNCKQPLGLFVLPALAAVYDGQQPRRQQWVRLRLILAGVVVGIAIYKGYDLYKFPPGTIAAHAEEWIQAGPVWTANPIPPLLSLLISQGTGVIWYCPTLLIACLGLVALCRSDQRVGLALVAASAGYFLFLSFVAFYKGDPCWGPRYLTPMVALWWLWAPAGAALLRHRLVVLLLVLGFLVQLLALSVDPQRLHLERALPAATYANPGGLHFNSDLSHLLNRPREIWEIVLSDREPALFYTPAPAPTFATPAISSRVTEAIWEYHVFRSLRPWWIHQQYLPLGDRPVDLIQTTLFLLVLAVVGLALVALGWRRVALPSGFPESNP